MEKEEYEGAIEVFPEREEPYICLLEQYVMSGGTRKGIEKIENYRLLYPEETASHQEILQNIGKLYFAGNVLDSDFGMNYEKAYQYLSKADLKEDSNIECYCRMAESLCKFGDEIDWKEMKEDLEHLERLAFNTTDKLAQIQQYQMVAAVYLANRYYFEHDGIDAVGKAIVLLELCEQLMEMESQSGSIAKLSVEIRMSLADACYTLGMKEKQSSLLEKSSRLYEELLKRLIDSELRLRIMLNLAYIKRDSEAFDAAAYWYEEVIKENPDNADGYSLYALMELQDRENVEKAIQLFTMAKKIKDVDKNQSYQVLKKRLEVLE